MEERQYVARSTNLVDRQYAAETPTDDASVSERRSSGTGWRCSPRVFYGHDIVEHGLFSASNANTRQIWRSSGSALFVRSTSPIVEICPSSKLDRNADRGRRSDVSEIVARGTGDAQFFDGVRRLGTRRGRRAGSFETNPSKIRRETDTVTSHDGGMFPFNLGGSSQKYKLPAGDWLRRLIFSS